VSGENALILKATLGRASMLNSCYVQLSGVRECSQSHALPTKPHTRAYAP